MVTEREQLASESLLSDCVASAVWDELERSAASTRAAERRAATVYLAAGAWRRAPELLILALADPDAEVAGVADRAMHAIMAPNAEGEVDPLALAMVAAAAETYPAHQSRAVAGAALAAGRRVAGQAWEHFESTDEGRTALVRALRAEGEERIRERAWEELGTGWLATAAVDRLRASCTTAEHAMVLERGHLALRPARRAAVAGLVARERRTLLAGLLPLNAAVMRKLGPEAWAGLARCAGGFHAEPSRREALARACLGHPSAVVRLVGWKQSPVRLTIDAAFDMDERVARTAALASAGEADAEGAMASLCRSAHASVRAVASQEMRRSGRTFEDSGLAAVGLRLRYAEDPAGVEREWRERWDASVDGARAGLVRLAARIGLLDRVADAVAEGVAWDAAADTDAARLAATVVRAMGGAHAGVGERGLMSTDPRVCSNAAEVVRGDLAGRVADLCDHGHHRVRATAIRRLAQDGRIDGAEAGERAGAMLRDDRAMHRLAGAWLAERVVKASGERAKLAAVMEAAMQAEIKDASCVALRRRFAACVERWVAELDAEGAAA